MRKKWIGLLTSLAMISSTVSAVIAPMSVSAATETRQVEYLTRGVVGIKTTNGVYLSWRLLGTEPLTQTFDIYRNGKLIKSGIDATNYTDTEGFSYQTYQVVPSGNPADDCAPVSVWNKDYYDIPVNKPAGGVTKSGEAYTYSINDTSVADLDGDGEYEYIIKWDPSNAQDNSNHGYTGNVLIDAYKMDGTQLWRVDLGINIRAGAHYTQFIVYDFDGDGKAEMALRTAPGSKDSTGGYVSRKGNNITWDGFKDTDDLRQGGSKNGHIIKGPDWLTMFNGETGEAMETIDYYPQRGSVKSWGDSYGGRSERYLAGVAYLNGKTPSLIMCRGYYEKAAMAAFDWDGQHFNMLWKRTDTSDTKTLYAQGNHQLSIADADNDGKDEIIFGSTVVDDNGNILNSTGHGHGDALHVSDFDNDGNQEVFQVHEDAKVCNNGYAAEYRKAGTGEILAGVALAGSKADNGRGVMGNIDDTVNDTSEFWSAANGNLYNSAGEIIGTAPSETNFLVYWDGDLARELLDKDRIVKYNVSESKRLKTFSGVHTNNDSKVTPALSADILGDWREEILYGTSDDTTLRIHMSTDSTDYKLTTLMHDTQYRAAVAWQNVGYNQPPHTSYYIGKAALSSDEKTLSPKRAFDAVKFAHTPQQSDPEPPEEEINTLLDSNGFSDSDKWGFSGGSIATESAPFNKVLRNSSGTSTKELNLASSDNKSITVNSFNLLDCSATITNNSGKTIAPVVAIAQYQVDSNAFSSVYTETKTIENGKTETIKVNLPDLTAITYNVGMLWDGLNSMVPLTVPVTPENPIIENQVQSTAQTLKFAFDWKPSANSSVQLSGAGNENIITLAKPSSGAITYQAGKSEAVSLSSAFSTAGNWFHVEMIEDPTSKTIDLSIQDYTASGDMKSVYAISFASAGNVSPTKMSVKNSCSIDNITVSEITYNVDRSLIEFNVLDSNGAPIQDAKITIGTKSLTTDSSGHAAIKLKSGNYSYNITKPAYKSASKTINAADDIVENVTLPIGEDRDIYVSYYFGDVEIADKVKFGTAKENTTCTVPDSAKPDLTYTFPESVDDLPPGYEGYAGQNLAFEFDPDQSSTINVVVEEGTDTNIKLYYKIKRVPVDGIDTELFRIQFAENGIGHDYWSSTGYDYRDNNGKTVELTGTKNTLTVNFPKTAEKFVMEYDMMFKSLDWGGNWYGITLYNGNNAGSKLGLRGAGATYWQLMFNSDKEYVSTVNSEIKYPGNFQNQRLHFILVSDGKSLKATIANADTGALYVDNFTIPYLNSVGTTSRPINKVVFGPLKTNGGSATYALKNFKAYTIGAQDGGTPTQSEQTIIVPGTTSFTMDSATHVSDIDGIDYNVADLIGVTYELQDASGNVVTPSGFSLSADGILTVSDNADFTVPYYVVTKINGKASKSAKLKYLKKVSLFTSSFRGDTDGFVSVTGDTSKSSFKAEGGSLSYRLNYASTGGEFYKVFDTPVTSGKAELEFTLKTGGTKDASSNWNWSGREYELEVQILDKNYDAAANAETVKNGGTDSADKNIIFALSQEYTTSAQKTKFRTRGTSAAAIEGSSSWKKDSSIADNPINRSSTTWNIKAELDFDKKVATFSLKSKDYEGYTLENVSLDGIDGLGSIRFIARKKGSSVDWSPSLSNVKLYQYIAQ